MDGIIIREALPEDAEKLLEYMKKTGGETDNLTFGAEGLPITAEQEKDFIQGMAEAERSVMFTAWKGGELVGTGCLNALPRRMAHRAELAISVLRAEWDKGIGNMLMKELIAFAKNNGIEIINLEVRSDNARAIHLYEKHGFLNIGTSPAYFKINGEYIDFEVMYLDLRDQDGA